MWAVSISTAGKPSPITNFMLTQGAGLALAVEKGLLCIYITCRFLEREGYSVSCNL